LSQTNSITNSFERRASAREPTLICGHRLSHLASGQDTGERFALLEVQTTKNLEFPAHTHTREDEMIYLLEGDLTFQVGGSELEASAGSFVFLPRGIKHSCRVKSEQARLLMMFIPSGLEHFFFNLACTIQSDTVLEPRDAMKQMLSLADEYGLIFPKQKS
jgi:quercetin dioxygenase-like cupin family protein